MYIQYTQTNEDKLKLIQLVRTDHFLIKGHVYKFYYRNDISYEQNFSSVLNITVENFSCILELDATCEIKSTIANSAMVEWFIFITNRIWNYSRHFCT